MSGHDSSYKHIFAHSEVVADLLRGFVHEDWVEQINYATLERVSGSYVADDLRDRADDIVWRVKRHDDWLYIYLLIEFQSRVDPWMALRIMVYTGLLYQDLIKSDTVATSQKLPPVFPIVIYNGEGKWTAARDIAELIEPVPGSLAAYRPSQKHCVLDEGRIADTDFPPEPNYPRSDRPTGDRQHACRTRSAMDGEMEARGHARRHATRRSRRARTPTRAPLWPTARENARPPCQCFA